MSILALLAKGGKLAATGAKALVKSEFTKATKPIKDLGTALSGGGSKESEANVEVGQGVLQASRGQIDMTPLNSLKSFMSNMDTGFYKHKKVKGTKEDTSKWNKL